MKLPPPKLPVVILSSSLVFSGLAFSSSAFAQNADGRGDEGFYITAGGGLEFFNDSDFDGVQDPVAGVPGVAGAPANVDVDYNSGFSFRGGIGYEFKKGVLIKNLVPRVEVEFAYAEANVGSGSFNGGDQTFVGDIDRYAISAALYSDIRWSDNQKIIPYFGGGVGVGVVDADVGYFPATATAPTFQVDGSSSDFSTFSAIGLTVKATDRFDVFLEGRYTRTSSGDFERQFIGDGSGNFSADLSDDTESFGVGLGARFRF